MTNRERSETARRRVIELTERNKEIAARIAELRKRTHSGELTEQATPGSVARARAAATDECRVADEAYTRAAAERESAADTHDQTARRHDSAASSGSGDPRHHRQRAAWHRGAAAKERADAAGQPDRPG